MTLFFIAIVAYLIGNISFSVLIGKLFFKKDVRNYGSGNAGTTNAIRAFGAKIGVLTFIGDVLKGVLAAFIGKYFGGTDGLYIAGIMVIIGHNYPVFLKFKGGKGVATTIGVMFVVIPLITTICLIIGLALAFSTRMVSLGSVIAVPLSAIINLAIHRPFDIKLLIFSIFYSGLCLFMHRENIKRLIKHEERKL